MFRLMQRVFLALLFVQRVFATVTATTENDPSVFVNGVNVITGAIYSYNDDYVVESAEPIRIQRSYISGVPFSIDYAHLTAEFLTETNQFVICEPNGTALLLKPDRENKIFPTIGDLFYGKKQKKLFYRSSHFSDSAKGISNTATGVISAQTNLKNYTLVLDPNKDPKGKSFTLYKSDGTIRRYVNIENQKKQEIGPLRTYLSYAYKLVNEVLPNGHIIHYRWDNDNRIRTIFTTNGQGTKTFGRVDFPYYKPNSPPLETVIQGSDGRSIQYKRSKDRKSKGWILCQVLAPGKPAQTFEWQGDALLKRLLLPGGRKVEIEYESAPPHRVTKLFAPVGNHERSLLTHSFFYEKNKTTVTDAQGAKKIYFWDDNLRLTRIESCDARGAVLFSEAFSWKGAQLQARARWNEKQEPIFVKQFTYDEVGNVVRESLFGNLTGEGPSLVLQPDLSPIRNGVDHYAVETLYSNDGRNLPVRHTEPNGLVTCIQYLPNTNLPTRKEQFEGDHLIYRTDYKYNEDNILIEETYRDDIACLIKTITPNAEGRYLGLPETVEEFTSYQGERVLLRKTRYSYGDGAQVTQKQVYDSSGELQYTLHYEYQNGKLVRETNPEGQSAEYGYDELGNRVYAKEFGENKETIFTYDHSNRLINKEEKGKDGQIRTTRYEYDARHNLLAETDYQGHCTHFVYDDLGRKTETIDPLGGRETISYDSTHNPICKTDPEGNTTRTSYNARGKPLSITHPDGSTETFTYSVEGHLVRHVDTAGVPTCFSYDCLGRVITKTIAGLLIEKNEYQGKFLVKKTDAEGNTTIFQYDSAGRKIAEISPSKSVRYTYDAMGRLHRVMQGDLATVSEHDRLDRVVEERKETPSGQVLSLLRHQYDAAGNIVSTTRIVNGQPSNEIRLYDSFQRCICKTNALGHTETFLYEDHFINQAGQAVLRKTHTDALGLQTLEIYDVANRLVAIEKRKTKTLARSEKRYNHNGNLIAQTDTALDPRGAVRILTTQWEYDSRGRIARLIEANQKITSYRYTAQGHLETLVKPSGTSLHYTYDPLGHPTALSSSDGSVRHTLRHNRLGHLIAFDGVSRTVDEEGRILQETFPSGLSIRNEYDARGRKSLCAISHFDCLVEYLYDPLFLRGITRKTQRGHLLYTHTFDSYDLSGNLLSETGINQSPITYRIDPLSRRCATLNPYFQQRITHFDPVGNLIQMTFNDTTLEYIYDDLYQLISETGPIPHTYSYDTLNNRLSKDQTTYEVNALNQLPSHFRYDPNGNPIQDSSATYEYDALDRLVAIRAADETQIFTYDFLHRCLTKTVHKVTTQQTQHFIYDGQNEIGSCSESLAPLELRILGETPHAEISAAIAIELGNQIYMPIHDLQGNIAILVPLDRSQPTHYRYTAFGEMTLDGPTVSPWLFSSKRTDLKTGLVNFGRRYYLPAHGRWLTPDPAGFTDGMNLYAYVHNAPLTHLDEYGLLAGTARSRCNYYPERKGSKIFPPLDPSPEIQMRYAPHYYVNGINNTEETVLSASQRLLQTLNGRANIIPTYSLSFGFFADLQTVRHSKKPNRNYSTDFTRIFKKELQRTMARMDASQDPRKIFITCFSRGAADVYHTLKHFTFEERQRFIITACGPIMILPRNLGFIVQNLVSEGDWCCFQCNSGLEKDPEKYQSMADVHILDQIDGFDGFNGDHFFESATYQKGIADYTVSNYKEFGELPACEKP